MTAPTTTKNNIIRKGATSRFVHLQTCNQILSSSSSLQSVVIFRNLKADLPGKVLAYDHRVRRLLLVLLVGHHLTLYFPTQIRFPIGGERATCHGSKLTNSLGKQQLELSTRT